MSSHREAPEISKDPCVDNTDLYAFTSPDAPDTVTIIANYLPFEGADGGPNFYEFDQEALYEINVATGGKVATALTFQFRFSHHVKNPNTFLYNTGPITSLTDSTWNRPQTYKVTVVRPGKTPKTIGNGLLCPPCNIGPNSTPNYTDLAAAAVHTLSSGIKVFCGQRAEGFWVDLGSVFDLLDLRPFQQYFFNSMPSASGVNGATGLNVHTIALQIPKKLLTPDGSNPTDPSSSKSVIGVWASASRRKSTIIDNGKKKHSGPFEQVSRLGQPLVNEVLIPMSTKDEWNADSPLDDKQYAGHYAHPEVQSLIPNLYPGVFPHLAAYTKPRADLEAILLTGIPSGVIAGFQNYTGSTPADLLRLNMAVPPSSSPKPNGILDGDLAGYPNGRRVTDNIVNVELRAIAGVTIPLVDPSYSPDSAASAVTDGSSYTNPAFLNAFPYLGTPNSGYYVPDTTSPSNDGTGYTNGS